MSTLSIESIGIAAGVITTACWLPQIAKILRERSTKDISVVTQSAFTLGVLLWFIYGIGLGRPAIVMANGITLVLSATILALKLKFG